MDRLDPLSWGPALVALMAMRVGGPAEFRLLPSVDGGPAVRATPRFRPKGINVPQELINIAAALATHARHRGFPDSIRFYAERPTGHSLIQAHLQIEQTLREISWTKREIDRALTLASPNEAGGAD